MADKNAGASQEAIEFHYDMPAEFFALWLGKSMTYTAARYSKPGMSMDDAQLDKINYHLDCAKITTGGRMLDIGCGWGTLLKSAVNLRGAAFAHGLTLSPLQHQYINSLGIANVSASLQSYEHYTPDAPFDSITSVGAFEHFVQPESTSQQRHDTYSALFEKVGKWLKPGGQFSLQTMAWGDASPSERDMIKIHDIFPESDLPEIAEVIATASPFLELVSMENRPLDYAQTLAAWAEGLKANRDKAIEMVGEESYKFYLDSCKGGALLYRRRRFYLCRFVFRHRGR